MPRTVTPVTSLTGLVAGITKTTALAAWSDVANGNVINGFSDHMFLECTPTAGGTVTFTTPGTVSGRAIADDTVTLSGTTPRLLGPFSRSVFGDNLEYNVSVNTIAVVAYQTVEPT